VDVNSHSLGILSIDQDSGNLMNSIILLKNTELLASKSEVYYTTVDNQNGIQLHVTEGEDDDPEYVRIIGEADNQLENGLPEGAPLRITISYDDNGLIHAFAQNEATGMNLGELKIDRTDNLSKDNVDEKQRKLLLVEVE